MADRDDALAAAFSPVPPTDDDLLKIRNKLAEGVPDREPAGDDVEAWLAQMRDMPPTAADFPHPTHEAAVGARRRVYAEDQRRNAARALDRYVHGMFYEHSDVSTAMGEEFIERVGEYVLARLGEGEESHYGATEPVCGDPEHRHNGPCKIYEQKTADRQAGPVFGDEAGPGYHHAGGCEWPRRACIGHSRA